MSGAQILARQLRVSAALCPDDITLHLDRAAALNLCHMIEREAEVQECADRMTAALAGMQAMTDGMVHHSHAVLQAVCGAWALTIIVQWCLS